MVGLLKDKKLSLKNGIKIGGHWVLDIQDWKIGRIINSLKKKKQKETTYPVQFGSSQIAVSNWTGSKSRKRKKGLSKLAN